MELYSGRMTDRDDYETPARLFEQINRIYRFNVDGAASKETAKVPRFFSNVEEQWCRGKVFKTDRIWCNPPFSEKEVFLERAAFLRNEIEISVFILPGNARETSWWRSFVVPHADQIINLYPRVNYLLDGKETDSVGFSSSLVIYGNRPSGMTPCPPQEFYLDWRAKW